jgi:hypothetical protein
MKRSGVSDEPQPAKRRSLRRYLHSRLLPSGWVRLLRLLPGKFEDEISCELVPVELVRAPGYEPISYCWGDASDRRDVICHGRPFSITVSLFQALRRFRYEGKARLLWADGICIDQSSIAEREQQVAFMDQVYRRGVCTLVWLGELPRGVDVGGGISLMKDFNKYAETQLDMVADRGIDNIVISLHKIPSLPADHTLMKCERRWQGVQALFASPYFTRIWAMLLELPLSRRAEAYCGRHTIQFVEIALFAMLYLRMAHNLEGYLFRTVGMVNVHNATADIWSTFETPKSWMDDGGILQQIDTQLRAVSVAGFLQVLDAARGFRASLDFDYIYALSRHPLAFNAARSQRIIDIDYERTAEETCVLLAENICVGGLWKSVQPLAFLCYVVHKDDGDISGPDHSRGPSWVPIWHRPPLYDCNLFRGWDATLWQESWSRDNTTVVPEGQNWQEKRLRVAALLLGQVTQCTEPFSGTHDLNLQSFIRGCWNICSNDPNTPFLEWDDFLWSLVRSYPGSELLSQDFVAYCRNNLPDLVQVVSESRYFVNDLRPSTEASATRFQMEASSCCRNKKFITTDNGMCGTGPLPTRARDVLAIIFGCPTPVLLRPTDEPTVYRLVGHAYVNKLMLGRAVRDWKRGKLQTDIQEITLA